jgi:tetratricopeptide (TPR) repeat protein
MAPAPNGFAPRDGVHYSAEFNIEGGVAMDGVGSAMVTGRLFQILAGIAGVFLAAGVWRVDAGWENDERTEVTMSAADFQKLETFEGHELAKADKVFAQKDYRGALANYSAFMEQYPKSVATAYVLLRRGRCLHLDNKRFEAIKAYNEVLDYFPNAIDYAASALFYIGLCHFQNGDAVAAVKAWTEMVQDADYRKHALAAVALCRLGDLFTRQEKWDDAAKYYIQASIEFRRANPEVARFTMERALGYLIRTKPDEPKLAEFYQKVETFQHNPAKPNEGDYWYAVKEHVRRFGAFAENEKTKRQDYYRYWSGMMAGKLPQNDEFQIELAEFNLMVDGDREKWNQHLDRQFAAYQTPKNHGRVIRWLRAFGEQKAKVQEYYAKLNFAEMNNGEIESLIQVLFDYVKDAAAARNAYDKIQQDKWTDGDRNRLADYVQHRDESLMERVCASMTDKNHGRLRLMRYYHWRRMADKALKLADELVGIPSYSKECHWVRGEMLQQTGKYPEAISAYQFSDRPPESLYRIADCFLAQGKVDQALTQLREIENFFKDQSPHAALRIAYVYRDYKKDTAQYQANLRGILKKYPASGQSNVAHEELERMGVRIGGGVDAK